VKFSIYRLGQWDSCREQTKSAPSPIAIASPSPGSRPGLGCSAATRTRQRGNPARMGVSRTRRDGLYGYSDVRLLSFVLFRCSRQAGPPPCPRPRTSGGHRAPRTRRRRRPTSRTWAARSRSLRWWTTRSRRRATPCRWTATTPRPNRAPPRATGKTLSLSLSLSLSSIFLSNFIYFCAALFFFFLERSVSI
jgi:hypothetical protein